MVLPPYAIYALTALVIGIASAIANMGIPAGALLFNRFARLSINFILSFGFALFAIGYALIWQFHEVSITVLGAFIACTAGGILMPLMQTWIMARLPFAQSGRGSGGFMGSFFLGNFLSPITIAMMSAFVGGLVPAIGVMGIACAVITLISCLALCLRRGASQSVQSVKMHGSVGPH